MFKDHVELSLFLQVIVVFTPPMLNEGLQKYIKEVFIENFVKNELVVKRDFVSDMPINLVPVDVYPVPVCDAFDSSFVGDPNKVS